MVRVVAPNYLKKDSVEKAAPLFREMIAATRKEDGCIEYRLFTDPKNPAVFVFIEEWTSQEALDRHCASEHFKRIIPQIGALCEKPGDATVLHEEFK
ncbi:MAG: antibiotic biosynthesis monooxygenase [Clostridiales bacterium]|jgi:quinol monooxygenase YgiN|nr:antibiotic biosynthesis monooxygenase [Clostridiales bacterium]